MDSTQAHESAGERDPVAGPMAHHPVAGNESTQPEPPATSASGDQVPTTSMHPEDERFVPAERRPPSLRITLRWLLGLWALMLIGGSLLWPVTYGYDELEHFDMAYEYSQHPTTLYAPGALRLSNAAVAIAKLQPPNPANGPFATAPISDRGSRLTLAELGGPAISPGSAVNQMVQHPPLYYWLGAVVLRLPGVSHLAWDQQFWLVRLLSVLLMLPVPLLCFGTARRMARTLLQAASGTHGDRSRQDGERPDFAGVGPQDRFTGTQNAVGLIAAIIPMSIPNLIRDGSAVTNDSLLISATSFFLYFLVRICFGELTRKVVAGASIAVTVALLTKGFALVLPPVLLAGLIIGARTARAAGNEPRDRRNFAWIGGIYAACMVVGGLWWLRNLLKFSTVQVNGFGPGANTARYGTATNDGSFIKFFPDFFNQTVERFWGGFGLPDTPFGSSLAVFGWPVLLAIGLLTALLVRRARGIVSLSLIGLLLTFAVLTDGAWAVYSGHPRVGVQGAQGRYFYHLIVALAAISAVGWANILKPRVVTAAPRFLLVLALVTNASAWFMILDNWYAGGAIPLATKLRNAVHGLLRWSPVPKPLTLLVFLLVVAMALICARHVRRYCLWLSDTVTENSR